MTDMDAGPGDNRLETIDASGVAGAEAGSGAQPDRLLFCSMGLSNGDFGRQEHDEGPSALCLDWR
jgi:hypothetical protein